MLLFPTMGLILDVRDRVSRWLAPPKPLTIVPAENPVLRKILQKSLQVTEELEMRRAEESQFSREDYDRRAMLISEIEEAIALAHAPWQNPSGQLQESANAGVQGLIKAREFIKDVKLRETIYGMAELEIALDDRGWKRLIASSQYEFSRFGIQSIMLISRLYYIKNPLARRGVDVSAFYVFGRGMDISSPDPDANESLKAFFQDPRNAIQFSHTAFVKKEKQTYTDGNVFWAFFADPQDGRLACRCIDPLEMSDIICDPEDADTPWFYRRDWTEERFDPATGRRTTQQRTQWYFALNYEGLPNFPANQRMIEGYPVALDANGQPIPVYHLKDGDLAGWKFGCPRMYCVIDWLRAYKQGLEDLCTTWRALSRFAWNVETKGGAPAIAAFKQTLATALANDLSQIETNPPPVTGSAFISGPTNKMTPMQTGGSTTMNPDNLRRVLLMLCAGFGLPESTFGDASIGSLATAEALERQSELMFLQRQEVWREVVQTFGHYALSRSIRAPKGKLREALAKRQGVDVSEFRPDSWLIENASRKRKGIALVEAIKTPTDAAQTITIDVKFPDIMTHDIEKRVEAIMKATTLDGKQPIGIDVRVATGLFLSELGVEDVEGVLEAMYPMDTYEMDRTIEPPQPNIVRGEEPVLGADAQSPQDQSGVSKDPAVIERAVQEVLRAARRNAQRIRPASGSLEEALRRVHEATAGVAAS